MFVAVMTHAAAVTTLKESFAADVLGTVEFRGEQTVVVAKSALGGVLKKCRDTLGFDALVDITTIDHLGADPRFEIVYELYSYAANLSLRIKSSTPKTTPSFPRRPRSGPPPTGMNARPTT
jgi:NADH-quinone oxidoreductase subunit C